MIEKLVRLPRRDRDRRTQNDERQMRPWCERCQLLADALTARGPRYHTEGDIRAERCPPAGERRQRKLRLIEPCQSAQHGSRIGRAAAHPRLRGDPLRQRHGDAAGKTGLFEETLRGAHHEILPPQRSLALRDGERDRLRLRQCDAVRERNAVHEAVDGVIPVSTLASDGKCEIDFGMRRFYDHKIVLCYESMLSGSG